VELTGSTFILDNFGAIYESQAQKVFPPYKLNLTKEDCLSFQINDEVLFTYDVLDVSQVYD
jgi:hypothetical protein